jgi:hypothetical protein
MTERPILFSAPMVRALLDGTKTQTRRPCKPANEHGLSYVVGPFEERADLGAGRFGDEEGDLTFSCAYGQPGDRLWVRETFALSVVDPDGGSPQDEPENWDIIYRADPDQPGGGWTDGDGNAIAAPWKSSIHMPRWASRILLEIVSVRVERLQDISEADADAEGCERLEFERYDRDWNLCPKCGGTRLHCALGPGGGVIEDVDCVECDTYVKRYRHLWERINGAGSWDANPWVWVINFKRVRP